MQRRAVIIALVAIVSFRTAHSQDLPLAQPYPWFDGNPTARSFGMGFAGMTSVNDGPSLLNPAGLGLWALTGTAYQMHNWERGGPGGGTQYDLSNTVEAVGVQWSPSNVPRAPRFSMGLLHRIGHSRVGPYRAVDYFWTEHTATSDRRVRTIDISAGMDVGVQLALGWMAENEEEEIARSPSLATTVLIPESQYETGYLVRLPAFHALWTWGLIETMPRLGDLTFDLVISRGANTVLSDGISGNSIGLISHLEHLPLLSLEYARDNIQSIIQYGWDVELLGSFALRTGNRDISGLNYRFLDEDGNPIEYPDFSTVGFAVDVGSAQRWLRYAFDLELSSTVSWILDRIDLRYETAWFRHPELRTRGLGDISIRQWTVGLNAPLR